MKLSEIFKVPHLTSEHYANIQKGIRDLLASRAKTVTEWVTARDLAISEGIEPMTYDEYREDRAKYWKEQAKLCSSYPRTVGPLPNIACKPIDKKWANKKV